MGLRRRLQTLEQRWHEYGPKLFAEIYGRRLCHAVLPAWAFRIGSASVIGLKRLCPGDIPVLRGFNSRVASPADVPALCSAFLAPSVLHRFLADGSICAVAESGEGLLAMVWARIGPADCAVDASYGRGGYVWRLEEGEAWLHNGEARSDLRGTGVYLTAYRKLIEELARLGVSRCYGQIDSSNMQSRQTHRRLQLQQLGTVSYVRVLFLARYRFCCRGVARTAWTLRRNLTVPVREFESAGTSRGDQEACVRKAIQIGRPVPSAEGAGSFLRSPLLKRLAVAAAIGLAATAVWQLGPWNESARRGVAISSTAPDQLASMILQRHNHCVEKCNRGIHQNEQLPHDRTLLAKAISDHFNGQLAAVAPDLSDRGSLFHSANFCCISDTAGCVSGHVMYVNEQGDAWLSLYSRPHWDEIAQDAAAPQQDNPSVYSLPVDDQRDAVVAWHQGDATYVCCGRMEDSKMRTMVQDIRVALQDPQRREVLAAFFGPK